MTTIGDPGSFAARLRAERLRLGLTQGEVAVAAGIAKPTQVAYELGNRAPGVDYIPRISAVGFDIWFVHFGIRIARHASQSFNWDLLLKVNRAIVVWSMAKGIELTQDETHEIARALYDQFLPEECVDDGAVDRMLTIATSRHAA